MKTLLALSLLLAAALPTRASDWPMARRTAARTASTGDIARPPLTLRWTSAATGARFVSSPVVYRGAVYIGGEDGKIYAFDAVTGALRWSFTTGGFVDSTPAAYNGLIYASSFDGFLYALDAQTGALVWKTATGGRDSASPAAAGAAVYTGSGYPNKSLLAYGLLNGKKLWQQDTGQFVYSSPASDGSLVAGGSNDGSFYFLDANTGAAAFPRFGTAGRVYFSALALGNGRVYGVSGDYQQTLYSFDAATGVLKSSSAFTGGAFPSVSSVALSSGTAYVAATGGGCSQTALMAFDAASGAPAPGFTTYLTASACPSKDYNFTSSPVLTQGALYLADADGALHFVDPAAGTDLSPPLPVGTGAALLASPAVANGWVYAASFDGKVYAYQSDETVSIAAPSDVEIVASTATVQIKGALKPASGQTFTSYKVEVGNGASPSSWQLVTATTAATSDGSVFNLGTWSVAGLVPGTYTLRLTATFSGAVRTVLETVRLNSVFVQMAVSAAAGGTVQAQDGTRVVFPAGGLSQDDQVTISAPSSFPNTGIPPEASATGVVRDFSLADPATKILKNALITLPYLDSDIAGISPASLRIYYFDPAAALWRLVNGSTVNAAARTVSVETSHFSLYRIMGFTPGAGPLLDSLKVYSTPNPARGSSLTFKVYINADASVKVSVYTIAAQKVAELSASGAAGSVVSIPWEMADIASGVYIYKVEAASAASSGTVIKKLAVIH